MAERAGLRVLVAEDNPVNQKLIRRVLEKMGLHVRLAANGQIAFDMAMQQFEAGKPFDVILMDMQMPVLDGLAATQKLRQSGYTGKIISLTANAMESDRKRCLDAGCDDYTCKPINREKLVQIIVKHATESPVANAADAPQKPDLASKSPLVSDFAGDPDMAELVEDYVMNLPQRAAAISSACASEQLDVLRTLAHQVKGSAGGYGFGPITEQAAEVVEQILRNNSPGDILIFMPGMEEIGATIASISRRRLPEPLQRATDCHGHLLWRWWHGTAGVLTHPTHPPRSSGGGASAAEQPRQTSAGRQHQRPGAAASADATPPTLSAPCPGRPPPTRQP